MATLFERFVETVTPTGLRGTNGLRLVQTLYGFTANVTVEAARLATKLSWTKSLEQPDDALVLVGEERILNAMPQESPASYRARLANAWVLWEKAGNPATIEALLAAGGYPLKVKERQDWPGRAPIGYWSIFWLLDDTKSIPAAPAATYGSGITYAQPGKYYGVTQSPTQPTPPVNEVLGAICYAVNKARPAHIIVGGIVIPGTAPLYGNGHTYGSINYGGTPPLVLNC